MFNYLICILEVLSLLIGPRHHRRLYDRDVWRENWATVDFNRRIVGIGWAQRLRFASRSLSRLVLMYLMVWRINVGRLWLILACRRVHESLRTIWKQINCREVLARRADLSRRGIYIRSVDGLNIQVELRNNLLWLLILLYWRYRRQSHQWLWLFHDRLLCVRREDEPLVCDPRLALDSLRQCLLAVEALRVDLTPWRIDLAASRRFASRSHQTWIALKQRFARGTELHVCSFPAIKNITLNLLDRFADVVVWLESSQPRHRVARWVEKERPGVARIYVFILHAI